MSTVRQRAIEALEQQVHDEYGWLSDAQNAQLQVGYDATVSFCGEGSIDLGHIVSIVLQTVWGG